MKLDKEFTLNNYVHQLLDFGHRTAIVLTGWLPLSTRSIAVRLISAPFLIPLRIYQSWGAEFSKKMSDYLVEDWNRGITDFYTDLEDERHFELRDRVVHENLRYAAYMYSGLAGYKDYPVANFKVLPNHILISALKVFPYQIEEKAKKALIKIKDDLSRMGFRGKGENFYHKDTKICFNLAYDIEKKEIIFCFMGLNAENRFRHKDKGSLQRIRMAVFDWLGGHPPASLQAIEIGNKIKEAILGTDITAVMVGHSHGGGVAQVAAAANGLKSVVFNSRPMGGGMRRYIGQQTIANNAKKMVAFTTKGDWLTDRPFINLIAIIFERVFGIVVPRNVGTGYRIPNDSTDTHEQFYYDMNQCVKNHPAVTVSNWLNRLYEYKFDQHQTLFEFKVNQVSLEVEANYFKRQIVISSYLDLCQIDKLSELSKEFPNLNFEYFKYRKINSDVMKIHLAFSLSVDVNTIVNENEFKKILEEFSEDTLKIEKYVNAFSEGWLCKKWDNGSNLLMEEFGLPNYGTLHHHKLRHGFGAVKI